MAITATTGDTQMGLHRGIYIADSDIGDLENCARVLYQEGFSVSTFQTGQELIRALSDTIPTCVLCDASLADLNVLQLMNILSTKERYTPALFMDRNPSAALVVEVMKRGAIDFLVKPFPTHALLRAAREALNRYNDTAIEYDAYKWIQARFRNLTVREREILKFVVAGMLNKQVAVELGISEKTVKVHRGRVMRKLEVQSVAELVRLSDKLASFERLLPPNSPKGEAPRAACFLQHVSG